MLQDIVIEKKLLMSNKLFRLNKYIYWILDIKDILLDFLEEELCREKIDEFIDFLFLIQNNDISFMNNQSYRILELEDEEYKLKFMIDSDFRIEYTVKESNTNYLFDVHEELDNSVNNIIYNQVKDNINNILNEKVYDTAKDYFLKQDKI